jgi:hypothetical protein
MPSDLTVAEVLTLAAFFARDLAAILSLMVAATALLTSIVSLLVRKRARVENQVIEGGIFSWVATVAGCLAPLDEGGLFGRVQVISAIVISSAVWVLVIIIHRLGRSRKA